MKQVYHEVRTVRTSIFRVEAWVKDGESSYIPALLHLYQGAPNDREGATDGVVDEWSTLRYAGEPQAIREAIKQYDAAMRKYIESLAEDEVLA